MQIENRIVKFKVNPSYYNPYLREAKYRKHYFHVHVFEDRESMYRYGLKLSRTSGEGYLGIVIPFIREHVETGEIAPKIGDVLISKEKLGSAMISHEAVHMATTFLRVVNKLKLNEYIDDDEECLAYTISNCCADIINKLYKYKLL